MLLVRRGYVNGPTARSRRSGLLVVGCWLLVAGCWLLVAGCWLSDQSPGTGVVYLRAALIRAAMPLDLTQPG